MTWLALFVGFCAGTVMTAWMVAAYFALREEDITPPHPERTPVFYDWEKEEEVA